GQCRGDDLTTEVSHAQMVAKGRSGLEGPATVDPAEGAVADVRRLAPLRLEELDDLAAASTAAADHEDATVGKFVEAVADLAHGDVHSTGDVAFSELVVLADVEHEGAHRVLSSEGVHVELSRLSGGNLSSGL